MMEQALHYERELADIKAKQAAAEEQHRTIFRRLDQQDKLIDTVNRLASAQDKLASMQGAMSARLDKACTDLEAIKARPGKRWELIVTEVIKLAIVAAAGYLIGTK